MAAPTTTTAPVPTTVIARRLRRLMEYLKVDEAEFARRAELDPSYVNRLLAGDRGAKRVPSKLILGTQTAFAIGGHYWTARLDVDPAKCHVAPSNQAGGTTMGVMVGTSYGTARDIRRAFADVAAEHDDPPEVIKGLLRTEAPPDADAAWWFRRYLALRDGKSTAT